MARRIDYVITVDDAGATAKVADFERRATTAGTATGGLAGATRDLASAQGTVDRQTQAMVGTVTKYGTGVATATEKVATLATGLDVQTQAMQATDRMLADLEKRYPSVATTTVEMTTATEGLSTASTGLNLALLDGVAKFSIYAAIASVVTEAIVGLVQKYEDMQVAAETAAAKQDVINKAYGMSGVVMSYGDAVKFVNEQLERTNPLADHAGKALQVFNLAMAAGPINEGMVSMRLFAKAGDDVQKVLQQDLLKIGGPDGLTKAMDLLRSGTATSSAQFNEWAKNIGLSSTTISVLHEQVKAESDAQRQATEATKKATEEYDRQQKALQRLVDTADQQRGATTAFFFGVDELEKAEHTVDVISQIADQMDVMALSAERQKAAKAQIDAAFDDYIRRGKDVPPQLLQIAAALEAILIPAAKLGSLGSISFPLLSTSLTMSDGSAIPAQLPNIAGHSGTQFAVSWWDSFSGSLKHYFDSGQFTNLMVHGLTGGGGIGHAVIAAGVQVGEMFLQSMMKGMGNTHAGLVTAGIAVGTTLLSNHDEGVKGIGEDIGGGAMTGAAIGSIIPGIGTAVGAGVGAVVGAVRHWIQSMGPSQAELSGRGLEGQFEQSFGGFTQMMQQLGTAYAATGHSAQQAQADVKGLLDAEKQGPAAVQVWIDKINQVRDAYALQDQALQDVNDAAQRYGITLEELGPALQKQNLDAMAQQLYKDWKLLTSAGVDQTVVIGHMSSAINDYVHDALRMGIEVPAAMQPMLQQMVNLGQLTDENGNIITDLSQSGIHFAETMTQGFQKVVDAVEKLATAIEQRLGLAIQSIPPVDINVNTNYTTTGEPPTLPGVPPDTPGFPSGGFGGDTVPVLDMADGTGGAARYASGEMYFHTKGNEYYAFSGEGRSFGSFAGASMSSDPQLLAELRAIRAVLEEGGHIPAIQMDSRVVAERVFDLAAKGKYDLDRKARAAVGLP